MRHTKEQRMEFDEQAGKIVSSLTLEEKVSLMGANMDVTKMSVEEIIGALGNMASDDSHYNIIPIDAGGMESQNVPPVKFVDGPRGVVCGNKQTTCFPVSMARGATFDPALEERVGHAIGKETRAFGGNLFAGVCINLPYNPGWGRSQETYGEESFHIGQMGAALVRGVQDEDVMACVKHFAFNQMENARFKCSVTCDQRTEKEVFLPHFKDCIDAGAASVMSSYNRYNSVHCGHHNYLLNEVLKGDWDFDGFVMSDFYMGVLDTVEAANGGQDMEMAWTKYFGDNLVKAVKDGFVPEEKIDAVARRIVRTILAFDKDHKEYDMSVVGCREHTELAREVAEKGITLVKNNQVLPFDKEKVQKIALIGKLADKANIGDHGSSWVRPAYTVTFDEGIRKLYPQIEVLVDDGTDLERARKLAAEADAVCFVVGYNYDDEGEFISEDPQANYTGATGGDRKKSLGLHEDEVRLLKEVAPVNPDSVAVLVGGNMIMMTEWYEDVNAVIMAYYPGMEGGTALAEILFGDVNPSGKLPYVVPYQEADLPQVDWEATDQYYEYYHGYTRLEKNGVKPLVPYGFGLSYTTFCIENPSADVDGDQLVVSVDVANTGDREGDEIVQVYVGFDNSRADRPVKQLKGFQRVSLTAGETKKVTMEIPLEKLKWYNPVKRQWELERMTYQVYVGNSSAADELTKMEIQIAK